MAKPVKIKLDSIHPTEYLLPKDKLDEIAAHYDGTPESIKSVMVIRDPETGRLYPENGNKRCFFLRQRGQEYILGFVNDGSDFPEELKEYRSLAARAESHGVDTLDDLRDKIVGRAEFERRMKEERGR
jgi:hypothetical protein